jgi:outer membrane receptor for ferrienterochelin and colicins
MRSALLIASLYVCGIQTFAQNTFDALVKDAESGNPLIQATAILKGTTLGASSGNDGRLQIFNVPNGAQTIQFSYVGYVSQELTFVFPLSDQQPAVVLLKPAEEELEEIVITSTRSSRTIVDIPTRVEFIAGEELDEKANMKPGDIRMLLSESTGIQTQQTSPTSANSSIRIQGLDGRYTQILKDGFPLYAGFSGGLGLLQTPPLDLKQVEVIKGSTSTLYGGGAIAGLVNLISRTPTEDTDLRFFVNGTTAKGLDLSGFYGKQYGKVGVTVFAARNTSEPYDPADIDLTAIPKFERYSFSPKLFVDFSAATKLNVGVNLITENRIGGDIHYIEGDGDAVHRYFESNDSHRYSSQLSFSHRINDRQSINVKNSFNHFDRVIETPGYKFDAVQSSAFVEINYDANLSRVEWVVGLNLWTDNFSEQRTTDIPLRDYRQTTLGAFVQNNLTINETLSLETGLRGDYVVDYGFALLPRASLLIKPNAAFSSRIGGGFGYKSPTIFTEETERIQYQNVLPISSERNTLEKSYGANWDLNYRSQFGEIGFSFNHLFFYTYLRNPLALYTKDDGNFEIINMDGFTDSKGTETNVKVEFGDFKLFIGYTFTDTKVHNNGLTVQNPLTAKHRLNNVLMYEVEEKWKIGLEAYYFSKQRLTDDSYGKEYWICGFMVEKLWSNFSVFINFENFLDARQTRFDTIFTGSISNPVFRDIYAPVDGFVINGGIKLKL